MGQCERLKGIWSGLFWFRVNYQIEDLSVPLNAPTGGFATWSSVLCYHTADT